MNVKWTVECVACGVLIVVCECWCAKFEWCVRRVVGIHTNIHARTHGPKIDMPRCKGRM